MASKQKKQFWNISSVALNPAVSRDDLSENAHLTHISD